MKFTSQPFRITCLLILFFGVSKYSAAAEYSVPDTDIGLTYEIVGNEITITDCNLYGAGMALIPATISGMQVTTIGRYAFYNCYNITSIVVPEGVEVIETHAFGLTESLESVSIPSTVSSIANDAFIATLNLMEISVHTSNANFSSINGVLYDSPKSTLLRYPQAKAGAFTLPTSVATVADSAFKECHNLTSIAFTENLLSIGNEGFAQCESITNLELPDSLSSIGEYAFNGCLNLQSVSIGDGIREISKGAFRYCSSMTSLELNDKIERIEYKAFEECNDLLSIAFPESLIFVGEQAFEYCDSLVSISLPDSLETLDLRAFRNCRNLKQVTLGKNLSSIGSSAFQGCELLDKAYFRGNAPSEFGYNVFFLTASEFTIYYLNTSTGFTSGTWHGYPAVEIDALDPGKVHWLAFNGMPDTVSLSDDLNGDGAPLLVSYALNLDMSQSFSLQLNARVEESGDMALEFFGGRSDITYQVQTCVDLTSWTTAGVVISEPDTQGKRVATYSMPGAKRFMRILIDEF